MLKTSHISAVGDGAEARDEVEDRRDRQRLPRSRSRAVAAEAQDVGQAAAGDVGQPADVDAGAQQLEDRAHVDDGRLEQRVGDRGAAELGGRVVEREAALLLQRAARQRVAVGVQAAGRHADDRVAAACVRRR